jgi:carbon storage regulator CsrA
MGMLVLSFQDEERLFIGDDIVIQAVGIHRNGRKVRLGIDAPQGLQVDREVVRNSRQAAARRRRLGGP